MKQKPTSSAPWTSLAYGIDHTDTGCTAVCARRRGKRVKYEVVEFSPELLDQTQKAGAAISAALPAGKVIIANIHAPFSSAKKAARVYPTLLDVQLPFPLEDCIYNFVSLESSATGTNALAIAARKCDIKTRLSELNQAGITPHILDHEGLALWTQLLREHPPSTPDQLSAVVLIRNQSASLVVGYGRQFLGQHKLSPENPSSIERYLKTHLNRIKTSDNNQPSLTKWFIAGQLDNAQKIIDHISQTHKTTPTAVNNPETFLARALATRAILPGELRTNLLIAEFTHNDMHTGLKRSHIKSITTVIISGLFLSAASLSWMHTVSQQQSENKKQFNRRITRLLGYKVSASGSTALLIAGRELEKRKKQQQQLLKFMQPSLLVDIRNALAACNSNSIKIAEFEINLDYISITGSAQSQANLQQLLSQLKALGYSTKQTIHDNDKISFTIEASRSSKK